MSIIKLNNRAVKDATTVGSFSGLGNLKFISRSTASSSSSLSITSGITSTYKEYIFFINNIHAGTQYAKFSFNLSSDSGSNYNVTKTTTAFRGYHDEGDTQTDLSYRTGEDLAQSTGYQPFSDDMGVANNEEGISGYLHLFEPSSTTFGKHFMGVSQFAQYQPASRFFYVAGYGNTTSDIDAIDFKFTSGNIDSGTIDMYGVL